MVTVAEQDDCHAVWRMLRLDEGLLFAGRWGSAKVAARQFKEAQRALGLHNVEAMGVGSSLVTGHTFRRTRGIHLLQHGRKREDIQEMYNHESWLDTKGYLNIGKPLWMVEEDRVPYSSGVYALLRAKLEQQHAGEDGPKTPMGTRKRKLAASSSSRSTAAPSGQTAPTIANDTSSSE